MKEFSERGKTNLIVSFRFPKIDRNLLKDYSGMFDKQVKCRLVSVVLPNGEKEILCTSLMDCQKYPMENIGELYHYRWNEEEGYKLFEAKGWR